MKMFYNERITEKKNKSRRKRKPSYKEEEKNFDWLFLLIQGFSAKTLIGQQRQNFCAAAAEQDLAY